MTTLTIDLPDSLAKEAKEAGLLTSNELELMLRERLYERSRRKLAGAQLRAWWARIPAEDLTPEIEQEIVDAVRAVRAKQQRPNGHS